MPKKTLRVVFLGTPNSQKPPRIITACRNELY